MKGSRIEWWVWGLTSVTSLTAVVLSYICRSATAQIIMTLFTFVPLLIGSSVSLWRNQRKP